MATCVRLSPFLRAGVLATGLAAAAAGAWASDVPFSTQPPISTTADAAFSAFAADVDGDGDTDVLSASREDDKVAWYENAAGNGSAWTIRTISLTADHARAVYAADVDGDGDRDALSASANDNKVAWYENTAGNGSAWTPHDISLAAIGAQAVSAADVDGDGDTDVLSGSFFDDKVAWYENTAGNGSSWTARTISLSANGAESVAAADVDGDGDVDALSASPFDNKIAWYENTAGNGTAWTPRTITTSAAGAASVFTADVDGDGDEDVLFASFSDNRVGWFDNTAGNGSAWTLRPIFFAALGANSVFAADLDEDGDVDALSTQSGGITGSEGRVSWYENTAGNGSSWTARAVSLEPATAPRSVVAADLDGDGDLDAVAVTELNDRVAWHRNETIHSNACFVVQPPIASTTVQPADVAAGDVDGDGDVDAFVGLSGAAGGVFPSVRWYENADGNGGVWTAHATTGTLSQGPRLAPADVDGDGDLDTFAGDATDGAGWFRNDAGNGTVWSAFGILPAFAGIGISAGDVDGDGDVDTLGTDFFPSGNFWRENAGSGSGWAAHAIAPSAGGVTAVGDVDGDGDTDVLSAGAIVSPDLWAENVAGNGTAWTVRTFPESSLEMVPTDVDGDGDRDAVFVLFSGGTSWRENVAGNGTVWTNHTITGTSGNAVAAADLDGDGDVDTVRASTAAPNLSWHENTAGNGSAWTSHDLSVVSGGRSRVTTADVDGDGDSDLLSIVSFGAASGQVDWLENRGGQVSLAASDIAPGGAGNGDVVAMLRIDAAHLGRAGDSDAELATLGLLFEESNGDPLTSAEANAIIENLLVYRDANGNGVFDLGVDVLVATVPTLVLTSGRQTVGFTDGDPNVQVSLATPRTYFAVTELTATASGQSPNQFRVTHLGTNVSASTAEDRTYDIRLRLACPVDVATAILGPITPVELLGFSVE